MEVTDVRISVSAELKEHYEKVIGLRDDLLSDPELEGKSLIGIINSTTSIIKDMARIQQNLYNSEKFAVLQQIIVNELREADPEFADKVLDLLEKRYSELDD